MLKKRQELKIHTIKSKNDDSAHWLKQNLGN